MGHNCQDRALFPRENDSCVTQQKERTLAQPCAALRGAALTAGQPMRHLKVKVGGCIRRPGGGRRLNSSALKLFERRSERDLPGGRLLIPFHVGVIHLYFVFRVPVDRGLRLQEVEESFYFIRVQTQVGHLDLLVLGV
jgi:hypothetical protein